MSDEWLYTACFSNVFYNRQAVSIARRAPPRFRGPSYEPLFPTEAELREYRLNLRLFDKELAMRAFNASYTARLQKLDAARVVAELRALVGPRPILCCWEKFLPDCHRFLLHGWLEVTGFRVAEILGPSEKGAGHRDPEQGELF